ncbi:YbaB/EbfC family DNA-binding protein [Nonomuraea sp. PA05]|uniref:YbaB/EbfC family nucleoid-associated protein n=1 Tax=Nonomuraea sp. PA05 TaxID=2604466 RepID=UPI0011DBF6CB|nr:YbaB/EbfC family nucleoid-associated protein [Nonomuraea sp. PA05]TYB64393.1 YbaB/EbfC family DNA-binding protein [Nonomuraea sp. PA05]
MQGFGDFANIDIDKLIKKADEHFARMEEFQKVMDSYVGRAQDEDGLVVVEYGQEGLRELYLHPKAPRLPSGDLADLIKAAVQEAAADLQRQINEGMTAAFGEADNPMRYINDPEAATKQLKEAEAAYNRTFDDVMGELDRIRRRLEL